MALRGYRYGFNGKENDNEVKREGNQQDYGMRIYDGRLGRFLSTDPLQKQYPELTPYQFSSNSPIANIDLDGLESTPAGKVYTDASTPDPKYTGGTIIRRSIEDDALTGFAKGFMRVMIHSTAALLELPGQAEFGDRVKQEDKASTFPFTHGQDFGTMASGLIVAPFQALANIVNDPKNPERWGEGAAILAMYANTLKSSPQQPYLKD